MSSIGYSHPNLSRQHNSRRLMAQMQQLSTLVGDFCSNLSIDCWYWVGDESGLFSVKSMRNLLERNRIPVDFSPFSWLPWIPLKVRCFGWHAAMGKIASKQALSIESVGLIYNR